MAVTNGHKRSQTVTNGHKSSQMVTNGHELSNRALVSNALAWSQIIESRTYDLHHQQQWVQKDPQERLRKNKHAVERAELFPNFWSPPEGGSEGKQDGNVNCIFYARACFP